MFRIYGQTTQAHKNLHIFVGPPEKSMSLRTVSPVRSHTDWASQHGHIQQERRTHANGKFWENKELEFEDIMKISKMSENNNLDLRKSGGIISVLPIPA